MLQQVLCSALTPGATHTRARARARATQHEARDIHAHSPSYTHTHTHSMVIGLPCCDECNAQLWRRELVRVLVETDGVDPLKKDNDGMTARDYALFMGFPNLVCVCACERVRVRVCAYGCVRTCT